jgi:hypothetical protein
MTPPTVGDDGSSIELGGETVSPAYLAHLAAGTRAEKPAAARQLG